jgi:hypothetical protein
LVVPEDKEKNDRLFLQNHVAYNNREAVMKIRELITVSIFLSLSQGIAVGARPTYHRHDQEKEERSKFYVLRVVSENKVKNSKDSLGAPDGRLAEILPGGQLVLRMEKKLYPFPNIGFIPEGGLADSGSVVGKGGADFDLEGWFTTRDAQGKQYSAWVPLAVSLTGFCIWPISSAGVNTIRITNRGIKSLFVDAVIGYRMETGCGSFTGGTLSGCGSVQYSN